MIFSTPVLAKKTNQPLYETPFDIAAGGAALTFAAKEGRIFTNPALLPFGSGFHQWAGSTTTALVNRESIGTVQKITRGNTANNQADSGSQNTTTQNPLLTQILNTPLRVGLNQTFSWLTSSFGFAGFNRFEVDLGAQEYGENGMPEIRFGGENYQGLALATGFHPLFLPWLTLGVTAKSVQASEPEVILEVTDSTALQKFQDPKYLQSLATANTGIGGDLGSLIFFQGRTVDFKWATTVQDIGNTKLSGSGNLGALKQVVSTGLGLTFHTGRDALHLALDYRDILGAYQEGLFKRIHAGVRFMVRTYVGLAAGIYDGNPSMGAEFDLIFMRISACTYKRELGSSPGVDSRQMMQLSLSIGY